MRDYLKFYIGGKWVEPAQPKTLEVINPATEAVCGLISLGSAADVDRAVKAAREAFKSFSRTSRKERIELLERIVTNQIGVTRTWRKRLPRRWARASLGKMPTTSVRRLISPFRRSIGLVECSLARCAAGKVM